MPDREGCGLRYRLELERNRAAHSVDQTFGGCRDVGFRWVVATVGANQDNGVPGSGVLEGGWILDRNRETAGEDSECRSGGESKNQSKLFTH
jgi:hypothetical protein